MVSGKYSALSGMIAREQSIANISANLANVNTTGYKRRQTSFESLLKGEKQIHQANGINYSRVKNISADFTSGPLRETENPLDMAISGDGFFKVQAADGVRYTRRGDFAVDSAGVLRTSNGMPVLDDGNGQITIPNTDVGKISVAEDGTVSIINPDGARSEVAKLAIVNIDDTKKLKEEEHTTYSLKDGGQEVPVDIKKVVQGSIETSNVNMTEEMSFLINNHRTFDSYAKVLESYKALSELQDDLGTLA